MTDPCTVVVIVLNWCGEEDTARCLESLLEVATPGLEILLVDNGSSDGSGERLRERFPSVDFLQTGANLGYAGGNNRGIERALQRSPDFVLVINNDTEVDPSFVDEMLKVARSDDRVGAVAPLVTYSEDRVWYGGGRFVAWKGLGVHDGVDTSAGVAQELGSRPVSFLNGCCLLLRVEALQRVGFFDESFFVYVEDVDLSIRMTRAGYTLVFAPGARIVHHTISPDAPGTPVQIRLRDINRRRLMAKHFGGVARMPFVLWFYSTRALLLVRYGLAMDRGRVRAIWHGMVTPL